MGTEVRLKPIKPGDYLTDPDPAFCKFLGGQHFKGASKNCKKVLVSTLVLDMIHHGPYQSHIGAVYYWGGDGRTFRIVPFIQYRMEIARARCNAVQTAIRGNFDYLFFYDDDTIMPEAIVPKLLRRMEELNAVSAGYFVRGYPFNPMVFRWEDKARTKMKIVPWNKYKALIDKDGVMRDRVSAVGNGCTMYRVEDFKKVPFPWFMTRPQHTEDAYWFHMAHRHIPGYKVGMDFNVQAGHLLDPLYVRRDNVDVLRSAYRKLQSYEA